MRTEVEIELAWLIKSLPPDINQHPSSRIKQAYLESDDPQVKDIRIRDNNGKYTQTIKTFAKNSQETGYCHEETKSLSKEEFTKLYNQSHKKVSKIRYLYPLPNNLSAELDLYETNLKGLNIVEVEFPDINAYKSFEIPDWFGKEVTDSKGIYPPHIANLTIAQVNQIN